MRTALLLTVVTVATCLLKGCDGQKARLIPVEDFFSEPEKTNFQLSPNGEYIAYLGLYNGEKNIYVICAGEEGEPHRITSETEQGIHTYFWANNDELVFTRDKRNDSLQVFAVHRSTLAVRHLMRPSAVKLRWISPTKVKDNSFLISLNERDSSVFDVYRLGLA